MSSSEAADPLAPTPQTAGLGTILVVDDETAVRTVMGRLLRHAGYQTLEAQDGSEAIHIFAEHASEIVAVLLDLAMPTTNGRETLAMLHAYAPKLPIVIATAYAPTAELSPQPGERGVGFLQKPFSPEELTRELRRVIAEMA